MAMALPVVAYDVFGVDQYVEEPLDVRTWLAEPTEPFAEIAFTAVVPVIETVLLNVAAPVNDAPESGA